VKKLDAQKMRETEREREMEIYWKETKVHWDARIPSKLEKLDECRMPNNMGPREYVSINELPR
jgi:hypothetical protein